MSETIIFKGQPYRLRIILSWIALILLIILSALFEYWVVKISTSGSTLFGVIFSLAVFAVLAIILIRYISVARPDLICYTDKLCIGDKTIQFEEIKSIDTIVQKISLWPYDDEVVKINLDSSAVTIHVSIYSNGNLFRVICEKIQINISKNIFEIGEVTPPKVVINPIPFSELRNEDFKEFRPNPLASPMFFLSLITLFITVIALVKPFRDSTLEVNLLGSAIFFLLFLATAFYQKYFMVSDKYLVIRYYLYFWSATIIRTEDIKRIQMIRGGGNVSLQILTSDYVIHEILVDPKSLSRKFGEMIEAVNKHIVHA